MKPTAIERFLAKVNKQGQWCERLDSWCYHWTASYFENGYGAFWLNGDMLAAHRASYTLFIGPIPPGEGHHGICVRHRCDNQKCVNPEHLELGTVLDNNRDMAERKRAAAGERNGTRKYPERVSKGERHAAAKLTDELVRRIRTQRKAGALLRELEAEHGICQSVLSEICNRKAWKHVADSA